MNDTPELREVRWRPGQSKADRGAGQAVSLDQDIIHFEVGQPAAAAAGDPGETLPHRDGWSVVPRHLPGIRLRRHSIGGPNFSENINSVGAAAGIGFLPQPQPVPGVVRPLQRKPGRSPGHQIVQEFDLPLLLARCLVRVLEVIAEFEVDPPAQVGGIRHDADRNTAARGVRVRAEGDHAHARQDLLDRVAVAGRLVDQMVRIIGRHVNFQHAVLLHVMVASGANGLPIGIARGSGEVILETIHGATILGRVSWIILRVRMIDDRVEGRKVRGIGSGGRVVGAVHRALGRNADLPRGHRHAWLQGLQPLDVIRVVFVIHEREERMGEVGDVCPVEFHHPRGHLP